MRTFLWACVLLAVCVVPTQAQTSIKDIVSNPGRYSDSEVEVVGTVARHVQAGGNTSTENYLLQGDSGRELRVQTTEAPPAIDSRVRVRGIVTISPIGREAVLVEQNRTNVSNQQSASESETSGSDQLREGFSTTMIFLIFGLGVLVVSVLAYFAYASQEEEEPARRTATDTSSSGGSDGAPQEGLASTELGGDDSGGAAGAEQRIKSSSSSSTQQQEEASGGPETLKFKAPPKTMKFIPGKLVVAAGPDQGKEFRIAGHPTPEGNVVTLGRAEVEGERAFAHIQLGDTYRTVSRMQAEIIQQDDDILLKNKSNTNPTIVNGEAVEAETTVELEDGDIIRMGELMLRYESE